MSAADAKVRRAEERAATKLRRSRSVFDLDDQQPLAEYDVVELAAAVSRAEARLVELRFADGELQLCDACPSEVTEHTVVHMLAHELLRSTDHGPDFCTTHLRLLERWIAPEVAAAVREEYERFRCLAA